jgi:hypothetical protein
VYSLLKEIWLLPLAPQDSNPSFTWVCEALHLYGQFAHHLITPYICIDLNQYFTLPHMSLWTPCRLCGVRVESVQTPRTLIHLSKVHTDSVQTLHGLRMDFARTYILQ